jgi:hypothetical protein
MGRGKSGEFDGDDGGTEELTCFIPMTNWDALTKLSELLWTWISRVDILVQQQFSLGRRWLSVTMILIEITRINSICCVFWS